jgi:putative membrane protein
MQRKFTTLLAVGAIASAMASTVVIAEEPVRQPGKPARSGAASPDRAGTESAAPQINDMDIAHMVLQGNQGEIMMSKLAEQHSKNEQVRKFAKQMVQEHGKFVQELRQVAGIEEQPAAEDESADRAPATGSARKPASERAGHGEAHDWRTVTSEICHRKQQMCLTELEQKQGEEFDKAYVGSQIGAHNEMLASLEVLATVADAQLQTLLKKGVETTQQHLKHAKALMQELEGPRQARAVN